MRTIIWDLGGTLIDTYPDVDRALARAAFGDQAQSRVAEVAALTRVSSGHAIEALAVRTGVPEEELSAAYDGVKDYWQHTPAPVMAGAQEVMAAIRAAGGLNLVATHRDRSSAEQLITATGLAVDDMVCAPDGHPRKPSPALIEALLQRHHLQPTDVLVVGDRPVDLEAGRAAGVDGALLVTPGIPLDAGAARRIGDLRELLPLVSDPA
ncbi:HAD family hydrolase [Pseudactinotalea sp.]|uniref:HAD family hydrolase n=1 Tax=Pseudactinotalea sp. TaxID=1926260 RepID=UPI003B3A9D71